MHPVQKALLRLSAQQDLSGLSLRQIASLVEGVDKPQIIKHHLGQLEKMGLMYVDSKEKIIKLTNKHCPSPSTNDLFYSIPVVGGANCGPASIFADESIEGYLKVSVKMLPCKAQGLYILIAKGASMNLARINNNVIENGDFVVVDSSYTHPINGDIIIAVIDDMATIKRYKQDKPNKRIVLEAESTDKYLPIFLHEEDNFVISGKVIEVIKKPK